MTMGVALVGGGSVVVVVGGIVVGGLNGLNGPDLSLFAPSPFSFFATLQN